MQPPQRSPEWHLERAGRLTASNFAAAVGINPHTSRQRLWRILTGRERREVSAAMRWGIDHERDAIRAFEVITGRLVDPAPFVPYLDWLGASPDGWVDDEGLLECKCPLSLPASVPAHHLCQIQGQLACTGKSVAFYCAWTTEETRIWRVARSQEYWAALLPPLEEFWAHVKTNTEPPRRRRPALPEITTERIV